MSPAVRLGHWLGDFLNPARDYFGPGCASLPPEARAAYFASEVAKGHTHIVINGHQHDWGPDVGHPEWTHGGYNAYDDMPAFVEILKEMRVAGASPVVGCVDQNWLKRVRDGEPGWSFDVIIRFIRWMVDATWKYVGLYQLSWEWNEVWRADPRNNYIRRIFAEVDNHGRDFGIHYNPPNLNDPDMVHGGLEFYGSLPSHAVRMQQFPNASTLAQIEERLRLGAEVNATTGTGCCYFEARGTVRRDPKWSAAQVVEAADMARGVLAEILPADRIGSLNG